MLHEVYYCDGCRATVADSVTTVVGIIIFVYFVVVAIRWMVNRIRDGLFESRNRRRR
jgi:uncharacterized protein HemY